MTTHIDESPHHESVRLLDAALAKRAQRPAGTPSIAVDGAEPGATVSTMTEAELAANGITLAELSQGELLERALFERAQRRR